MLEETSKYILVIGIVYQNTSKKTGLTSRSKTLFLENMEKVEEKVLRQEYSCTNHYVYFYLYERKDNFYPLIFHKIRKPCVGFLRNQEDTALTKGQRDMFRERKERSKQ